MARPKTTLHLVWLAFVLLGLWGIVALIHALGHGPPGTLLTFVWILTGTGAVTALFMVLAIRKDGDSETGACSPHFDLE